ncbi:2-aminoadipate transaminase-like [Saccoglossus kowalevskii]
MPDSINFFRPKGGYFVWLEFPSDVNASELKAYASKKYKISFQVGNKFSASGSYKNCIRINFTHYEEDILIPAIKNLCKSMHEFLNQ